MRRFGFKSMYGGQRWALWPSFEQIIISTWDFLILGTG